MSISFVSRGEFEKTSRFLNKVKRLDILPVLRAAGQRGVNALRAATPVDSSLTASSWGYEIRIGRGTSTISWTNTNVRSGVPIAIILQLGHGTGTGGWVAGRDYINPAIRPIFEQIAEDAWKVVTSA